MLIVLIITTFNIIKYVQLVLLGSGSTSSSNLKVDNIHSAMCGETSKMKVFDDEICLKNDTLTLNSSGTINFGVLMPTRKSMRTMMMIAMRTPKSPIL